MSTDVSVLVICGSLRRGSINRMIVSTLPELAPQGMTFQNCPSFEALPNFNDDLLVEDGQPEVALAIARAMRSADGLIFVTPEYNFSVPGCLKNMLDWVSRLPDQPLRNKPVAIQSAASGPVGGTRMQYHLRQIMVYLDAKVLNKPEIFVTFAGNKVDPETGRLVDADSRNFVGCQLAAFRAFIEEVRAV